MSIQSVVIIGSGNVATVLGTALKQAGLSISCVYSRNPDHADELGTKLQAPFTNSIGRIPSDADLYIVAIKDEAIETVSAQLNVSGLIVHTSGGTPLSALSVHKRAGVFYMLQTFSKHTQPDFKQIPFLIEAMQAGDENLLLDLAKKIGHTVMPATSEQRQHLHVAAVFANNFTNHLLALARQITTQHQLPFSLLNPLILQTISNALEKDPASVQTGPAIRHDENTIQRHLSLLEEQPELKKIYRLITESIQQFHSKKA